MKGRLCYCGLWPVRRKPCVSHEGGREAAVKRVWWRGSNEKERAGARRRERPGKGTSAAGTKCAPVERHGLCCKSPARSGVTWGRTTCQAPSQADTASRRFSPGHQKCPIPAFICLPRRCCDVGAIFRLVSITCPHSSPAGDSDRGGWGWRLIFFFPLI